MPFNPTSCCERENQVQKTESKKIALSFRGIEDDAFRHQLIEKKLDKRKQVFLLNFSFFLYLGNKLNFISNNLVSVCILPFKSVLSLYKGYLKGAWGQIIWAVAK